MPSSAAAAADGGDIEEVDRLKKRIRTLEVRTRVARSGSVLAAAIGRSIDRFFLVSRWGGFTSDGVGLVCLFACLLDSPDGGDEVEPAYGTRHPGNRSERGVPRRHGPQGKRPHPPAFGGVLGLMLEILARSGFGF